MNAKEFIENVVADGGIIGKNNLGIEEIDGDFPIVPKNLIVSINVIEECENNEDCLNCHHGGCCNNCTIEEATISRIGGKDTITFVRWCGYQIGSVWTRWHRSYNE